MNEQELDKLLNSQKEETLNLVSEKQFQHKIRKAMNKIFYGRVLLSVLLIAMISVGLYFATSKAVDLMFYRPEKEAPFLVANDGNNKDFTVLLEDTISTYFPGKYCWVLGPIQSHGFSRYSAELMITDAYGPKSNIGPENSELQISFSQLDMGHAPLNIQVTEFWDPEHSYSNAMGEVEYPTPNDIRQELQDLPKSAYLDISLSFPASISSEEVAQIINNSSDMRVRWLALEGQNTSIYDSAAGGMFIDHPQGHEMTAEAALKYPNYVLPQEITGENLEQCLQSRLQMLIDHPEFVALMESQFEGMISMPMLKERLKNAQENWACYGMRVVGHPEQIEKLMDDMSVTHAQINNVKVSIYDK